MTYVHEVTNTVQMQKLENSVLGHTRSLKLHLLGNLPFSHSVRTSPSRGWGLWVRSLQWGRGQWCFHFSTSWFSWPLLPSWELLVLRPSRSCGTRGDGERWPIEQVLPRHLVWLWLCTYIFPSNVVFSLFLFLLQFSWPWRLLPLFVLMVIHESFLSATPGCAGVPLQLPVGGPVGQNPRPCTGSLHVSGHITLPRNKYIYTHIHACIYPWPGVDMGLKTVALFFWFCLQSNQSSCLSESLLVGVRLGPVSILAFPPGCWVPASKSLSLRKHPLLSERTSPLLVPPG